MLLYDAGVKFVASFWPLLQNDITTGSQLVYGNGRAFDNVKRSARYHVQHGADSFTVLAKGYDFKLYGCGSRG